MKINIKLSVRDLVESVLKSGDLISVSIPSAVMAEGTIYHKLIQNKYPAGSKTEHPVSVVIDKDNFKITVNGKIDGLLKKDNYYIIDEIKSVATPIKDITENYSIQHWAQAKCYGFIYAFENNLTNIYIQLTYINRKTKEIKIFQKYFSIEFLKDFFDSLINDFLYWEKIKYDWLLLRNNSIKHIIFPFIKWRKEQRKFAVAVYNTIKSNNKLFAQAPTGTGKTIAALFPSIKSLSENLSSKIFYLTAKTTTRMIAEDSINILRNNGLKLKSVIITAKDKICFEKDAACEPDECSYARGYYDKINTAINDIFKIDSWTGNIIEVYARKHKICPFEFSLDLSIFADVIICDYNYLFDPFVFLKRFFMDEIENDYIFLIDEAHNLVDRARDMFSASIDKKEILKLKKDIKNNILYKKIKICLTKLNSFLLNQKKICDKEKVINLTIEQPEEEFIKLLQKYIFTFEKITENKTCKIESLTDFYFNARTFIKINDLFDNHFTSYYQVLKTNFIVKIFCLDPSELLKKSLRKGKASVFFSATLSPFDYYISLLGGDESSFKLKLNSPFNPKNLKIMINNKVSTKFKDRDKTIEMIADNIIAFVNSKKGNYFIFFPSYKYMNNVFEVLVQKNHNLEIIIQESNMSENKRDEFLQKFSHQNKNTLVGMTIMGGVFGEGIDLIGDRLNGVVIVGVGLPQICFEREIIKNYFNKINSKGFQYSYIYPGMLKVLQAVGRIIRTETDTGAALLIDKRFTYHEYMKLLPPEWKIIIK